MEIKDAGFSKKTMPNVSKNYKLISDGHILSTNHITVWFVNLAWSVSVDLQVFWWRDALDHYGLFLRCSHKKIYSFASFIVRSPRSYAYVTFRTGHGSIRFPLFLPGVMCLPSRSTQHFCCLRCSVVQVELQKAGTRVEGATCQGTAVYGVSWNVWTSPRKAVHCTPQTSNIDTRNGHLFQTIVLGIRVSFRDGKL